MNETQRTLQMHCEAKSASLLGALDALNSLDSDDRKIVLKALRTGNTQPITNHMATYRRMLAEQIGATP